MVKVCLLYSIWLFCNSKVFEGEMDLAVALSKLERGVEEFLVCEKVTACKLQTCPWSPPRAGSLAVNVDASVSGNLSAMALVARDSLGRLSFSASKWDESMDPTIAKLKAFVWATNHADELGWRNVEWRSNA